MIPALLAASALSFVLTMAELSAAVLVYPPGRMTLPVRLVLLLLFGDLPVVAAHRVMVSGFIVGVLVVCRLVTNRPLLVRAPNSSR